MTATEPKLYVARFWDDEESFGAVLDYCDGAALGQTTSLSLLLPCLVGRRFHVEIDGKEWGGLWEVREWAGHRMGNQFGPPRFQEFVALQQAKGGG